MATLNKDQPKAQVKQQEEDSYKRDMSHIRRRDDGVQNTLNGHTGSYSHNKQTEGAYEVGSWRRNAHTETKKEDLLELVKKYNPTVKKEEIMTHLNIAGEVGAMFRKGDRRRHNYGYVCDLTDKERADKAARDAEGSDDHVSQRLNFIKRSTLLPSNETNNRYERTHSINNGSANTYGTTSTTFGQRSVTPTPLPSKVAIYEDSRSKGLTYTPREHTATNTVRASMNTDTKTDMNVSSNIRKPQGEGHGSITNRLDDQHYRSRSPISRPTEILRTSVDKPSNTGMMTRSQILNQNIDDGLKKTYQASTPLTNKLLAKTEIDYSKARDTRAKPTETFEERYSKFQQEHEKKYSKEENPMNRSTADYSNLNSGTQKVRI